MNIFQLQSNQHYSNYLPPPPSNQINFPKLPTAQQLTEKLVDGEYNWSFDWLKQLTEPLNRIPFQASNFLKNTLSSTEKILQSQRLPSIPPLNYHFSERQTALDILSGIFSSISPVDILNAVRGISVILFVLSDIMCIFCLNKIFNNIGEGY